MWDWNGLRSLPQKTRVANVKSTRPALPQYYGRRQFRLRFLVPWARGGVGKCAVRTQSLEDSSATLGSSGLGFSRLLISSDLLDLEHCRSQDSVEDPCHWSAIGGCWVCLREGGGVRCQAVLMGSQTGITYAFGFLPPLFSWKALSEFSRLFPLCPRGTYVFTASCTYPFSVSTKKSAPLLSMNILFWVYFEEHYYIVDFEKFEIKFGICTLHLLTERRCLCHFEMFGEPHSLRRDAMNYKGPDQSWHLSS